MIIYLLKFIACSGILLLFYHFVLQHDRLFKFNRFFLLAIVGLALIIPITTVRTNYIETPVTPTTLPVYQGGVNNEESFQSLSQEVLTAEITSAPIFTTERILIGAYLLVTLLLLLRFGNNLYTINRLKRHVNIVEHSGINIVLRSDLTASFSFLNYMFTNKERYEQGNLPEEIIQHEKLHIKQHHSIDIIVIELFQCFFWFNPFIYLIRKAVKLNHEFLADAFVIGENTSAYNYQKILLEFTGRHLLKSPLLASNLNYGFTKKRLNMMAKNTNIWRAILKQICALAIITVTFWMLGITETVAQEVERKPIRFTIRLELPIIDKSKPSTPNGSNRIARLAHTPLLDNPLMRYELDGHLVEVNMDDFTYEERVKVIKNDISLEYFHKIDEEWRSIGISFKPEQDKEEVPIEQPEAQQTKRDTTKRPLYIRIGAQKTSRVRFTMKDGRKVNKLLKELTPEEYERFRSAETKSEFFLPPKPKMTVDQATFNEFLNEEVYGIWIDGKKVSTPELNKYKPADIHHYRKDKLYRGAKKDKGYTHEISIVTIEHFNNSPNVNGKWILSTPSTANSQEQSTKEKPEAIEVDSVKEEEMKEEPQVIKVKSVRQEKIKEKPKVIEIKKKEKAKNAPENDNQDLGVKKGGFNPQLHSPGIDLDKVDYFLVPTASTPMRYLSKSGDYVVKTYKEMTDKEYSRWINPLGKGQIFNPPSAIVKITRSRLYELKKKEGLEFWINGKLANEQSLASLEYYQIYDLKEKNSKVDIVTEDVFLTDATAWMSRIRYKKTE